MADPFVCTDDGRRRALLSQAPPKLNGIDYIEVASDDETLLDVFFFFNLPGTGAGSVPAAGALDKSNVLITGGATPHRVDVLQADTAPNVPNGPAVPNWLRVHVRADARGFDYSTYTLSIVTSAEHQQPPAGFDPKLSTIQFSFKANCPSEFDCKIDTTCPPRAFPAPALDYLAKDFDTFRRLMLDRMSVSMPSWTERHPADMQVALVELLAYVADNLSWFQDAAASEAYLGTARRRVSLRRHARLLDYLVHDGSNARTVVHVEVGSDVALPAGTRLLTAGGDGRTVLRSDALGAALAHAPAVFETLHVAALHQAHNEIALYTWQDLQCWLPRGSTRATLSGDGLALAVGDLLLFEEVLGPQSGLPADADRGHRQLVRLTSVATATDPLEPARKLLDVAWDVADALSFPLCISARVTGSGTAPAVKTISVARANLVLADHGLTMDSEALAPALVPADAPYRPDLPELGVTFAVPYDDKAARATPAGALFSVSARDALACVALSDAQGPWTIRRDLLASGSFARDFVVESEDDGSAILRFGDETSGAAPAAGTQFRLSMRVGNGSAGNVGPDVLTRIVFDGGGILAVRNPLPASGGTDPESATEIRQYAPQAFRNQERAVSASDYADKAKLYPGVRDASASILWTGSWYTVYVYVDRVGGVPVDAGFAATLANNLGRYRMAGYDLEIRGPVPAPLDLALMVCVAPGYIRADVKQALLAAFGRAPLPDGTLGLFAPDNFTFGTPLYASRVYATAMGVAGVESVTLIRFQRLRRTAAGELAAGKIVPAETEMLRLDNDSSAPENGQLELQMFGGL
jgi:hypothetical protein